ncbi:MAG TPA: hypothetical protein VGJ22_06510 [Anaerolineales bacterium]|jgi:hypothetical protein
MDFDFSEVLSRGWQITWKHKLLWIYGALPVLMSLFFVPIFLIVPFGLTTDGAAELVNWVENHSALVMVFYLLMFVSTLLSLAFRLWGTAALTVGAVRAEAGEEKLGFLELLRASLPHLPNILGALLLVFVAVLVLMVVFFVCSMVVGFITLGIGTMFVQLLMYPLYLGIWIVLEQAQAAIVADGLSALDAVQRGWDLLKAHIAKYALIGVVVYLATAVVGFLLILPVMLPMWLLMFRSVMLESMPDTRFLTILTVIALVFTPVYALFTGVAMTFARATFVVTYLRLTRASEAPKVLLEPAA